MLCDTHRLGRTIHRRATLLICPLFLLTVACSDDTGQTKKDSGQVNKDSSQVKKDSGGGGSSFITCLHVCKKTDDCCPAPPCDKGPSAQSCEKGYCKLVGCSKDQDCTVSGVKLGTCVKMKSTSTYSFGTCLNLCTSDSQCTAPLKCVYESPYHSGKICGEACSKDSDCKASNDFCKDGKFCTPWFTACRSDKDCTGLPAFDKCDVATGRCLCTSDAKCQSTMGAAIPGTWKCGPMPF